MRSAILAALILFSPATGFAAHDLDLGHRYFAVYLEINDAEHLEKKADLPGALKDFKECYGKLSAIRADNPHWETALVGHRMEDCHAKILDLEGKLNLSLSIPSPIKEPAMSYPWKLNVIASLFWIGEAGVTRSAWDEDWVKTNGGIDSPDERNGFSASGHAAKLNPFYVALPFNDLAYPEMAQKWMPHSWRRVPEDGKPVSGCKDRWLQIKNAQGRSCFAQWEDAGPNAADDAEYVFGSSAPKADGKPPLSVSPAVAQYLQLNGDKDKPELVSWRFVDETNLSPGAWLEYDEQAVIYAAMNK